MTLGDFSKQADAYQRSRPTYPVELLDGLVQDAGVKAGDVVADFGAGTGIFTQLLLERGLKVNALEPNDSMRSKAAAVSATWSAGTFEESGLASESQDWATAAQAFHWADPPRALPEVRRILKPGRLITILWNDRVTDLGDVVSWTEQAIRRHVPDFDEAYRVRSWEQILESTGDFQFVNHRFCSHIVTMSRERFLDLWKSHNRLNTIAGPERFKTFYDELVDHLDREGVTSIDVQYDCKSWSARRVD